MNLDNILDHNMDFHKTSPDDYEKIINLKREAFEEEKKVKNGKITLGIMIVLAIISLIVSMTQGVGIHLVAIDAIVLLGSYVFGFFYCDKNPKIAFMVVLVVYLLFQIAIMVLSPMAFVIGFIFKGILIYFLAMGLQGGMRLEDINRRLENLGA